MKKPLAFSLAMALGLLSLAHPSEAAVRTYQVTGPVLEVNDTMIAVQKGKDRWEIARDASTKISGDLKVGSKVTVEYRMTATAVDVKAAAAFRKKAAR